MIAAAPSLIFRDSERPEQVYVLHALYRIFLFVLTLVAILDPESELKRGTVLAVRVNSNVAAEVLTDDLAKCETQADAVRVEVSVALERGKRQPDALLVLRRDSRPVVLHNHREHHHGHRVIRVDGLRARCHDNLTILW